MDNHNNKGMTRRRFLALAGLGTGVGAAGLTFGSGLLGSTLAHANAAKQTLRLGASVLSPTNERYLCSGVYHFAEQVEKLSDGELRLQIVDQGQGCAENTCGERVGNGIFQIGVSSIQNLGAVFPYSIALDWPMLWNSREEFLNFMFSPESNRLYRDVMAKRYGIMPLFCSGEMRNMMMGMSYADAPLVTRPEQLKGRKIRITNSEMIAGFAEGLGMNPIPLAWTELLEGLRSGVVDATETWPSAAAGFGMQNVISQDVGVEFSPGMELTFISTRAFDKLTPRCQDAVLEASYQAMIHGYHQLSAARNDMVGNGDNPQDGNSYQKAGVRLSKLSREQRQVFSEAAGVNHREDLYQSVRKKIRSLAGTDVLDPLRDFQASVAGAAIKPQRWWT